ncbi:MAG: glycosyltransferase family 39 protein [Candidatus Roizmanbacteria bacterium]
MSKKLILLLTCSFFVRLVGANQSFWLDETAQATISRSNILDINFAADFQPPLSYILSHFWQGIGFNQEWFLRLPSIIFGVLTIYFTYLIVKKLADEKTAFLVSIFLVVNPYHIYFSQEYRMYSMFAFLATLSWYLLLKKQWVWYGLSIVLMLYTHYFSFLVLSGQAVYMVWQGREDLKKWLITSFCAGLTFVPWLMVLKNQLKTAHDLVTAWPKWQEIAGVAFWKFPFLLLAKFTVGMISPPKLIYVGAFGLMVIITGFIFLSLTKDYIHQFLNRHSLEKGVPGYANTSIIICWLFIPFLIAWVASLWFHANSPHRFVFLIPAFCSFLAIGISAKKGPSTNRIYFLMSSIIGIIFVLFSSIYLFNSGFQREDWKGAISYVDSLMKGSDRALTEFTGTLAPMDWYSKNPQKYQGSSSEMKITNKTIKDKLGRYFTKNSLVPQNIFIFSYLFQISDPDRKVEEYIRANGYKLTEEKDFRGVGIVRKYTRY